MNSDPNNGASHWLRVSEALVVAYWEPPYPYPRKDNQRVLNQYGAQFFDDVRDDLETVQQSARDVDLSNAQTVQEAGATVRRSLASRFPNLTEIALSKVASAYAFYWWK